MPNFILTGNHCDGVTDAKTAQQTGQHQWAESAQLAEQLESDEKHVSLTLLEREYSYMGLRSWWQSIERQINQCAPDDRRTSDCHSGVANHESTPKRGRSEPQKNAVRDGEEREQAAELGRQEAVPSGRRSMQATPEALFLAEKLQQLADTTREVAQHLLSPEAARRRVSTPRSETSAVVADPEDSDLEFVRQKILLLDDVVEELSQYRLTPLALDMSERSVEEPPESESLRNESTAVCASAVSESTSCDCSDLEQGLDMSTSGTFLAEGTQNAMPYATGSVNLWSDDVRIADEDVSAVDVLEQASENADASATSADDCPPSQRFAAEVTTEETSRGPVYVPQRGIQMGSPSCRLDSRTSQEHRFSPCRGKEASGTAQRILPSPSKLDRLDRATTTTLRLLSYPIMRHALHAQETATAGEKTICQKMHLERDMAPSVTEPPQQEPQMNSSGSYLDTSTSDLPSHDREFALHHGNERPCDVCDTDYRGELSSSKPVGVDGMVSLVQRLLKLQIMAHA